MAITFSPSPDRIDSILDALADPDVTLREVAEIHSTTLEALTLFITRPDIAERLRLIESAVAHRTRLIAVNFLPSVVKTLNRILDEHNAEESHVPIPATNLRALEYRRRARETARRAASLLLRLSRFSPGAAPIPAAAPGQVPAGTAADREPARGQLRPAVTAGPAIGIGEQGGAVAAGVGGARASLPAVTSPHATSHRPRPVLPMALPSDPIVPAPARPQREQVAVRTLLSLNGYPLSRADTPGRSSGILPAPAPCAAGP
ncbi:MAG: hypothetical protein KF745_05750 [Phycisphaeraceae bacterium]|nr:hypothetical protein [Phycisphaeraceae bacterium]